MTVALAGQLVLGLAFTVAGAAIWRGARRQGASGASVGVLLLAAATVTAVGAPS